VCHATKQRAVSMRGLGWCGPCIFHGNRYCGSPQGWTRCHGNPHGDGSKCCQIPQECKINAEVEMHFTVMLLLLSIQCFDTVGWVIGRASGL